MNIVRTGPDTTTYIDRGITPESGLTAAQNEEHPMRLLETVVSRDVWTCSLEAARWERLIALRAAISAGTYRVGAEELADCLLRASGVEHRTKPAMYPA